VKVESLRAAIEAEVTAYALNHYRHGVSATFSKPTEDGKSIVCCIEDHQFQPKNYWNGRWRSQWTVTMAGQQAEVVGVLKVQVHYYEDGNVQLVSSKEVKESITLGNDAEAAKELVKLMEESETEYQTAISENYQVRSDQSFLVFCS